jgi:hypothetical protein
VEVHLHDDQSRYAGFPASSGSSPVAGPDGTLYALSAGGYASAVNDGKVVWERFLDHNYEGSSPLLGPDTTILSLSAGGYLTAQRGGLPKPDMQNGEKPEETTEQPLLRQEDGFIIIDGVKLPVNKK